MDASGPMACHSCTFILPFDSRIRVPLRCNVLSSGDELDGVYVHGTIGQSDIKEQQRKKTGERKGHRTVS